MDPIFTDQETREHEMDKESGQTKDVSQLKRWLALNLS